MFSFIFDNLLGLLLSSRPDPNGFPSWMGRELHGPFTTSTPPRTRYWSHYIKPSCQHFSPLDYLLSTTKYYHLNYLKHTFISGREHFGVHLSVQLPDQREGGRQRPQHRGRDHSAQVLVTGGSKQFLANTGCKSGRPGCSGNEERATLASQWVDSPADQIPAFHLQQGQLPFDHFGGRPHPFTYSRANWLNLAMLQGSIRQLAWSDCGNFVASGDTDRCVSVYTQNRWTQLSQTFFSSPNLVLSCTGFLVPPSSGSFLAGRCQTNSHSMNAQIFACQLWLRLYAWFILKVTWLNELNCSGTELTASRSLNCSLGQTRTLAKGEKLTFVQDSQNASKNQSPPGCCWAWAKTSSLPSSTSKPHHLPLDWFSCTGNYILNASSRAAEFIRLIRLFFTRLRGSKIFSQYIHLQVFLSSKPYYRPKICNVYSSLIGWSA